VRWGYATTNAAKAVPNPAPKRGEVAIFRDWRQVEAVTVELGEWGARVDNAPARSWFSVCA
jgi:hypothetical protein